MSYIYNVEPPVKIHQPLEHHFVPFRRSLISCYRYGHGKEIVICFHGYGERADHYRIFENADAGDFSFYCLDLPHHGRTIWKEGNVILPDDLVHIRKAIVDKHLSEMNDPSLTGAHTLMGYSLGGRVALRLFQSDPGIVKRLVLLATDGLKFNFWYSFCTQTILGNRLFHFTMHHSTWLFRVLKFVRKTKLVNKSLLKFITDYVEHPNSRRLIYHRWTTLRRMHPSRSAVKRRIRHNHTITRLLYGKFDRIMRPVTGRRFARSVHPFGKVSELNCGHQLLLPKNTPFILQALRD